MELTFRAVDVGDGRDGRWLKSAEPVWPIIANQTERTAFDPAGEAAARDLFAAQMPELVPVLDGLAAQLDRPGAAGVLTQVALKPFFSGCSMAGTPGALVRNYDFYPEQCERTVVASRFLRPVIGMGDFLWGLLDGVNDAGLAVALSFGGHLTHGRDRMSILLVVRYLLETCASVDEAWRAVARMPVSTSQNLILVDREQTAVVHLGPDRAAARRDEACVTNHQEAPVSDDQEASSATRRRLDALRATPPDPDSLVAALLRPPLYQTRYAEGMGTVYTADYRPGEGRVAYVWPGHRHEQSFASFTPGEWTVHL